MSVVESPLCAGVQQDASYKGSFSQAPQAPTSKIHPSTGELMNLVEICRYKQADFSRQEVLKGCIEAMIG